MGGRDGGGRTAPQARRPRHGAPQPFPALHRHNPRRPPGGASSAVGPPLSDAGWRRSAEQAQEPPYPGHCRDVGSRRIEEAGRRGGTAPTPPSRGHPPVEPLRPHRGKRGHSRRAPTAQPGRASQRLRPTPTPTTRPTAPPART
jgi:hypothetical protein